eukprot:477409_1
MAPLLPFILSISATVSIICLLCISLLHFSVHFRLRRCRKPSKIPSHRNLPMLPSNANKSGSQPKTSTSASPSPIDAMALITYSSDSRCQNCILPTDEETFEFFPISFTFYLLLTIALTALIIYKTTQTDTLFDDLNGTMTRLHLSWDDYAITDWILLYCVNYFELISLDVAFKYFCVYGVPYLVLSLLQIHVYYFLFPIVIIGHLSMNFWSNWMFAKILIDSTIEYAKAEEIADNVTIHNEMLRSVYLMRSTSLVWCCISVSCHSVFVIRYDVDVLCCYPLLWCIGSALFSLNFARNRSRLFEESIKLYQSCKHCSFGDLCTTHFDGNESDHYGSRLVFVNNELNTPETKATATTTTGFSGTDDTKHLHTATHDRMASVDEEVGQIGDIDVFVEDEDEMMIYEYDDPISLMALNRNIPRKSTGDEDAKNGVRNMEHIRHMTSSSDPMESNKRQHKLMPTMDLDHVLQKEKEMDLFDDDEESMEDEEEEEEKRGNKALQLLGIAATKHEIKPIELRNKVVSVSRSNTSTELPSSAAIFGHKRSQSMGHLHSDKFNIIIDKIDENNTQIISEITHKLEQMMERKSEVNPTILRRLDYQTKTRHKTKQKLHLKRSVSAPSSPRRFAQYLGFTKDDNDDNYVQMKGDKGAAVEMHLPQEEEIEIANNLLKIPGVAGLKLRRTGSVPLQPVNSPKEGELTRAASFNYNHRNDYDHKTLKMKKAVHRQAASMNIEEKIKQKSTADTLVLGFNALVLHGFYSRKSLNSVQQLTQLNTLQQKNKKYLTAIRE